MPLTMMNLPEELIELIFKKINKGNDRRRLALVCRQFHRIIRHQSKAHSRLRLIKRDPEKSIIRLFEDSTIFPFSKLVIFPDTLLVSDRDFWKEHGKDIVEIKIYGQQSLYAFMRDHLDGCFPNIQKLKFINTERDIHVAWPKSPITILSIPDIHIQLLTYLLKSTNLEGILYLLRSTINLKSLRIEDCPDGLYLDHVPFTLFNALIPWMESVENVKLGFKERSSISLAKINHLPSKVIIDYIQISPDDNVEAIKTFFSRPRIIQTLVIDVCNENYYLLDEFGDPLFSRDHVLALKAATSIKKLKLHFGPPDFAGSLDLLAHLPGLESIEIRCNYDCEVEERYHILYPDYWSLEETARKIHSIYHTGTCARTQMFHLECTFGLTNLRHFWSDDVTKADYAVGIFEEDHPHLISLELEYMEALEDGHLAELRAFKKLETLNWTLSANVELSDFEENFKFQNLRTLVLRLESIKVNMEFVRVFVKNCPNLENLSLFDCQIADDCLEFLVHGLPYLKTFSFWIEENRFKELKKKLKYELPYLNLLNIHFTTFAEIMEGDWY